MSGTARLGQHYTLDGSLGSVTIPAGASSASVVLTALTTALTKGSETATMTITAGTGYKASLSKRIVVKATVKILNVK
jgi:hypothetical protein